MEPLDALDHRESHLRRSSEIRLCTGVQVFPVLGFVWHSRPRLCEAANHEETAPSENLHVETRHAASQTRDTRFRYSALAIVIRFFQRV
jgi:hypothetical protein